MSRAAWAASTAFIASIAAANWLTSTYGFVPVGLGLAATAGTYAAGLTLGLRDIVQDTGGRRLVVALILVGSLLSWVIGDGRIALASGVAFLVSELADLAVYTPLRQKATYGTRRWSAAVAASNTVGSIIDTLVFLWIAFGAAAVTGIAVAGQLVGKGWATLVVVLVAAVLRWWKTR